MCCFRGLKQEEVTDLLQTAADFPLPVQETFPGDVLLGWKTLVTGRMDGCLHSSVQGNTWTPGEVFVASGKPSTRTEKGIYAYHDRPASSDIHVLVALWGFCLDFGSERYLMRRSGMMGSFAYPLEIHIPKTAWRKPSAKEITAWKKTGTYVFRDGKRV